MKIAVGIKFFKQIVHRMCDINYLLKVTPAFTLVKANIYQKYCSFYNFSPSMQEIHLIYDRPICINYFRC